MKKQTIIFLIADILFTAVSVKLAFALRFDGAIPSQFIPALQTATFLAITFNVIIFYYLGLYSFSWSYASTRELISLMLANLFSFIFLGAFLFILNNFSGFPKSALFIAYFLIILSTGGVRFAKRIYLQLFKENGNKGKRILIIGAGDAGEQVLRNIQGSPLVPYYPVGFIDDDPSKKGSLIHGVKVLGNIEDIPKIVSANNINSTMIAFPSAATSTIKKAVEKSRKAGVKEIKILPPLSELINGQISLGDIRDFKIESLLERSPVFCKAGELEDLIRGKTVLITGAAGSIGSEISRQSACLEPSILLLLDQDETGIFNIEKELQEIHQNLKIVSLVADIQDGEKIDQIFAKWQPKIVFHAAAYKHVPLMEKEPEEAVKNNIFGTRITAKAALANNAEKFVFISTDKAVNPSSVMGATKRIGEMICQILNKQGKTKFVCVRFGNVLGSRGSVIPVFKEQIKKGGPIQVTHENMERFFMIIPEAVNLVFQAGKMGSGGEVFVLDMGDPIRILDLAKELIRLSGFEPDKDIPIIFTSPRPGEKFSENILTAEEGSTATSNDKIFIAKSALANEIALSDGLGKLKILVQNSSREGIINTLKELVPYYSK